MLKFNFYDLKLSHGSKVETVASVACRKALLPSLWHSGLSAQGRFPSVEDRSGAVSPWLRLSSPCEELPPSFTAERASTGVDSARALCWSVPWPALQWILCMKRFTFLPASLWIDSQKRDCSGRRYTSVWFYQMLPNSAPFLASTQNRVCCQTFRFLPVRLLKNGILLLSYFEVILSLAR